MKRLEIVDAKIGKLTQMLLDKDDHSAVLNDLRKYIIEKKNIYQKQYDKMLEGMPELKTNENYRQALTGNIEFDTLFLELIVKYPHIINDMNFLMPIVNFINHGDKVVKVRELLSMNKGVFANNTLLNKINDVNYENIKEIFRSIPLMSSIEFKDYFKNINILPNKCYDNIQLMEKALKEGLNLDLVFALGSKDHAHDYFNENMSLELLDQIANSKTANLKKQILAIIFDCEDEKILNILVRFFEIKDVRDQLLDENSFYYELLIKPIKTGANHKDYGSIEKLLSTSSKGFNNYILACNNTDELAHTFDLLTGPYIYYHEDRRIKRVPVKKFTSSFNKRIQLFMSALEMINMLDIKANQDILNEKYEEVLNDDLKDIAIHSLRENEGITLSSEEKKDWNDYINATYATDNLDYLDGIEVTIGYGLDPFEEAKPITTIYPCFRQVINSNELMGKQLSYTSKK